jgi:hypothetical protein
VNGTREYGTCFTPLFGRECRVLNSDLRVDIYNQATSDASYIPPNINKWLTNLGLGNLTSVKGELGVYVWEGIRTIPIPIAPVF